MLRSPILYLSRSNSARTFITKFPVAWAVASRFAAGEQVADAIRAIRELTGRGLKVTADHLGENVSTQAEAAHAADEYVQLLEAIQSAGVQSHASIKLTQFGLDLGDEVCYANMQRVIEKAKTIGTFVRVDMESTDYTDRTLKLVRAAKVAGYDNVGTVIQSYLYRGEDDINALCADGIRVRLCKGAYQEPPDKAFPLKKDVDANYIKLSHTLLAAAKENPALYPALATHDEKMIAAAKAYVMANNVPRANFEFQMLYGVRRELQEKLVAEGYRVRVYVPFGREWYPYFMRRLAERPANLWFFLSNFLRR